MRVILVTLLSILALVVVLQVTTTTTNALPVEIAPEHPAVTVEVPGVGAILGNYETTLWTKQNFMQFRGIPYAESPRGKLRFKAPVARMPWKHIFNATQYGRRCPVITTVSQLSEKELKEDLEDCLNLCVYTKSLTAKRPVMVYIYGGGFYNGSASDHPPRHLLEKDIVLVVPQYRIGALGWLATRSEHMPGNAPILDMTLALKWVQNHIGNFGGDRENVTIFAQSAGTTLAGALILSPTIPEGLFKRAITQSGSVMAPWAINKSPYEQVQRICRALKCGDCGRPEGWQKCYNTVTVLDLLKVTTQEKFSPIEADLHGVLPQNPAVLAKKYHRNIPVMTGFTKHDGSFVLAFYYDAMKQLVGDMSHMSVRQFAEGIMDSNNDTTRLSHNLLTKLLFDTELLKSNNHKQALPAYFDLTNIIYMKSPVISSSTLLVAKGLADTYLYSFDYAGEHTRFGYEFGNAHYPFNGGIHHSNDNIYLFSTHTLNEADTKMAQKMVELWTSFAMTGVPTVTGGPEILPMRTASGPYFHIDAQITIGQDVLQELTATIDDPNNKELDRVNVEF